MLNIGPTAYGRIPPIFEERLRSLGDWLRHNGEGIYNTKPWIYQNDTLDGNVWYVSLAGSHLARIDSATGEISVIEPPTKDAGLRRVWADSRGDLWITGWNSGELYRYRPSNKSWKTWKLPGTAPKAYAVYVDERDMVWVSDFGDNSTRVFNPKTEKFVQRYPGSGEGANVRQILGRKGEVFLPESGTERLMVIRTDK